MQTTSFFPFSPLQELQELISTDHTASFNRSSSGSLLCFIDLTHACYSFDPGDGRSIKNDNVIAQESSFPLCDHFQQL